MILPIRPALLRGLVGPASRAHRRSVVPERPGVNGSFPPRAGKAGRPVGDWAEDAIPEAYSTHDRGAAIVISSAI